MTKTENKKNIKRQNEKNLIFERDVVIVEKKCDNCLKNCLSERKKKRKEKKIAKKNIKRAFVDQKKENPKKNND